MTGGELADAVALVTGPEEILARLQGLLARHSASRIAAEAVRAFGEVPQLRQAQEECAELIAAINRDQRGRDLMRDNLAEEAGQVFVMLLQVREIIGHDRFDAAVRAAQAKTAERVASLRAEGAQA